MNENIYNFINEKFREFFYENMDLNIHYNNIISDSFENKNEVRYYKNIDCNYDNRIKTNHRMC